MYVAGKLDSGPSNKSPTPLSRKIDQKSCALMKKLKNPEFVHRHTHKHIIHIVSWSSSPVYKSIKINKYIFLAIPNQ